MSASAQSAVLVFAVCVLANRSALAEVPDELLATPLALAFGAAPAIVDPGLSPDGNRMLFLQQNTDGASELRVLDFASGAIHTPLVGTLDGQDVKWCEWAKPSRLICEIADIDHPRSGRAPDSLLDYVAINADGTDEQRLRKLCRNGIDWMPDDPRHIFVVCAGAAALVDLYSNHFVNPRVPADLRAEVSDGHGLVRIAGRDMGHENFWHARTTLEDDWERFRTVDRMAFDEPFTPVGFGENRNEVLHLAWDSGTWGLFAMDITAGFTERRVFSHPVVDVTHVDRLGGHPRIVAAVYTFNGPQRFIFDERIAAVHDFVAGQMPGRAIEVLDESWDQGVYLVRAREPDRAGEFYRVDIGSRGIENVGAEYPRLLGVPLAPSRTIEIADANGDTFSAHLTLPVEQQGPLPAVLIPRGVPMQLDIASPSFLVQFLAASGYAVLQVNHRGSGELDFRWDFDSSLYARQQSATDVSLAGKYLVDAGIASSGKICALGWGPGAYVAAMAAAAYPQDLACMISIMGLLDTGAAQVRGSRRANPLLEKPSPLSYAQAFEVSALLFDGASRSPSVNFAGVLRRAGQDVALVEYDHVDQRFSQAPYRTDMLVRIGEFLETRIGASN